MARFDATAERWSASDARSTGRRADGPLLALFLAALLAACAGLYFGVNAGTDYPEPWTQAAD